LRQRLAVHVSLTYRHQQALALFAWQRLRESSMLERRNGPLST
jgi:hypothetical protein